MAEQFDIIVVGAGIGGLSAAVDLAARGHSVLIVDKAAAVGGKMRTATIEGHAIDCGPTVLTMREVFDALFDHAGARLDDHVRLRPLSLLARHAWTDGSRLDLHADAEHSIEAVREFAGPRDADGLRRFLAHTRRIYEAVEAPFIHGDATGLMAMFKQLSFMQLRRMAWVDWHRSMWRSLGSFFADPRLRQLFARYATYYGSSPFQAPATLNLIAHVEQRGVWAVDGGMIGLAEALAALLVRNGGTIRLGTAVEEVEVEDGRAQGVRLAGGERVGARAIVLNAVPEAVAAGFLGEGIRHATRSRTPARSLSAYTFAAVGSVPDFPLAYHNVLFSSDYRREFDQLRAGQVPDPGTVYLCAQGRPPEEVSPDTNPAEQRLFWLINAPARGDDPTFAPEIDQCRERCMTQMARCGLTLKTTPSKTRCTTPHDFARMFPGSGGSLYGPATHSLRAALGRPGTRTKVDNLYMTGGGVHPGAGVPMVALSGRLAASSAHEDLASTPRFHSVATRGGTSTESATMDSTP